MLWRFSVWRSAVSKNGFRIWSLTYLYAFLFWTTLQFLFFLFCFLLSILWSLFLVLFSNPICFVLISVWFLCVLHQKRSIWIKLFLVTGLFKEALCFEQGLSTYINLERRSKHRKRTGSLHTLVSNQSFLFSIFTSTIHFVFSGQYSPNSQGVEKENRESRERARGREKERERDGERDRCVCVHEHVCVC